jgi:Tol biopolymer transport system component
MDAVGQNRLLIASFLERRGLECVPSPDGHYLAFGYRTASDHRSLGDSAGLFVLNAMSGAERLLDKIGHHPAWTPSGRKLAYVAGPALWLYDPETEIQQKILAIPGPDAAEHVPFGVDLRVSPTWSSDERLLSFWLSRTV